MTREEFEEWLEERKDEALDNVQQSETTAQKWIARLHAALKSMADEEDAEEAESDDDDLVDDSDDADDDSNADDSDDVDDL